MDEVLAQIMSSATSAVGGLRSDRLKPLVARAARSLGHEVRGRNGRSCAATLRVVAEQTGRLTYILKASPIHDGSL